MSSFRQALLGVFAALLSSAILVGSIVLALAEGGQQVAFAFTPTLSPTPVNTPRPGEPTFTPSPSPEPSFTPTNLATSSCPPSSGWIRYTVLPGENLGRIALEHGTTPEILRQGNCDEVSDTLYSGTELNVPLPTSTPTPTHTSTATATLEPTSPPRPTRTPAEVCAGPPSGWVTYVVRRGDTLYRIATSHGISVATLMSANCLTSSLIRVGDTLWVPNIPPTNTPRPTNTSVPPTPTRTSPSVPTSTATHIPTNTATFTPTPTSPPATATPTSTNTPLPTPTPTSTPVEEPLDWHRGSYP